MKFFFKPFVFLLSCLLVLLAVPFAGSAAAEKPILTPGVAVFAARTDVAVSAMIGNEIPLCADDFEKGLNLAEVRYLTFKSVPPETDGQLLLASSRIAAGRI